MDQDLNTVKNVSRQWLLQTPNSGDGCFTFINENVDMACSTDIRDIIVLGDFNINTLNVNNNKIKELMQEYNMKQLISGPTNFTEHSSTLIDLMLVRNNNNILTSGVIDTFIPNQIRYHYSCNNEICTA